MNLLIVVLDCLRLDYWRQMKRSQSITRDWFHLCNHWSVAHCSDPNHAALFTGYGPWETKVTTQMGPHFKRNLPTIFWRWKREFENSFVWGVQPVKVPSFYRIGMDAVAYHKGTDSADLELRAIKRFVKDADGKQWLGFIRDMTVHYPYLDKPMPPRGSGGDIEPLYKDAVEHVDRFIENLVDYIQSEQANTAIVICSDHGELLGEHNEYDHLYTLYNYLVRVPMAIHIPGLEGKRTNRPTQHIDLMPTICELYGWNTQGEGESLMPWMNEWSKHPTRTDRKMMLQGTGSGPVSEDHVKAKRQNVIDPGLFRVLWRHRATVQGKWKLIENIHADGQRDIELFKSSDYQEKTDVSKRQRRHVTAMYKQLPPVPDYHDFEKQAIIMRNEQLKLNKRQDEMILKRLRELGYA